MRYDDWGVRSPRWQGIRSETVRLGGVPVHYLRADPAPEAPPGAPPHLLVHGMAASSTLWLDVIRPLTAYGPVIAPDLPGNLQGHTPTPIPEAARAEPNARFLRAFTAALGLERVIPHGWSLGGLVSLRFAALAPERVTRLVLVNPSLPAPLTVPQQLGWQTLGRFGLASGPALARASVRFWARPWLDARLRFLAEPDRGRGGVARLMGGDPARFSPDHVALSTEQTTELLGKPQQLGYMVTSLASAVSAMYLRRGPALAAIDAITAPVLLLWGDQDPLIRRPVIDGLLARRPDWDLHVLETAGHLAPAEVPGRYADAVGNWLTTRKAERPVAPANRDSNSANPGRRGHLDRCPGLWEAGAMGPVVP